MYGEARHRQYDFARQNWHWLSMLGLGGLAPNLISLFFGSAFDHGLLLGMTSVGTVGYLCWTVVMLSGTAPSMMGGEAERWTAEELTGLEAHGFRIVHHGAFRRGDVDHIVIGPGGAFVLETKWRSGSWSDTTLTWARRQAFSNAEALRLVSKRLGVTKVVPVVVGWGPGSSTIPAPALSSLPRDGDALVLPGRELRRWLLSVHSGALTTEQVDAVYAEIAAHARRRDEHDLPPPISLREAAGAVWRPALATYAALAVSFPITWLPVLGDLVVLSLALAAALVLRRLGRWRIAGTAAATVQVFFLLLVLAELATQHL